MLLNFSFLISQLPVQLPLGRTVLDLFKSELWKLLFVCTMGPLYVWSNCRLHMARPPIKTDLIHLSHIKFCYLLPVVLMVYDIYFSQFIPDDLLKIKIAFHFFSFIINRQFFNTHSHNRYIFSRSK